MLHTVRSVLGGWAPKQKVRLAKCMLRPFSGQVQASRGQDVRAWMFLSMSSKACGDGASAFRKAACTRLYRLKDLSSSQMNPKRSSSNRMKRPGVRSGLVNPCPAMRPVP